MMNRRGLQIGCAVVLAGAAAAGCSSGGSATKTTKTTTTTTTTQKHPTTTTRAPTTTTTGAPSTTTSGPTTTTTAAGVPPCTSAKLSVAVGQSQGAAGSLIVPLVFTNTGSSTCSLQGYPGVSIVGANGAQLGAAAARTGQATPLVTLSAGQNTTAIFRQANPGILNCTPVSATGFRVYPPNQTAALFAADPSLTTCPGNPQESPQISPVGTTP
ncbi:MAG TPA: DUF4232 domain-containing protein [Acidimicrobiales bacterium]